jgi:hypothetical protein
MLIFNIENIAKNLLEITNVELESFWLVNANSIHTIKQYQQSREFDHIEQLHCDLEPHDVCVINL